MALVVTMTDKDIQAAEEEGVWFPICPNCEQLTPAEPEATNVTCEQCGGTFEVRQQQ